MKPTFRTLFDGRTARRYEVGGFKLSHSLYAPRLRHARHTHAPASLSIVLAGKYLEQSDGKTHARASSTVVFHPPQESHAVEFESEVRILSVEVGDERLAQLREHPFVFDEPASCRTETINSLGRRLYQECLRMDAAAALSIEGLILELLAEAARCRSTRARRGSPPWLMRARDFLHANFAAPFTLTEVADVSGVHPVHLSRAFRENFGCTVGEYVRRLRVEFACLQITRTDAPLSQIAQAAGFADQSHLNKIFKQLQGTTPAAYRRDSRRTIV